MIAPLDLQLRPLPSIFHSSGRCCRILWTAKFKLSLFNQTSVFERGASKGNAMNISTSAQDNNDSNPAPTKTNKPVTSEAIIDLNLIAQLRKDIAKIGTQPSEGISKRQAVILLLPEITDARTRKVSFKSIEHALKARGLLISAATIGTYWRQAIADIEAANPKPVKPVPEVTPDIPAPEVDSATLEQKVDAIEAPKTAIVFHDITDDDEVEDHDTLLRNMGKEPPNAALSEWE